MKSEKKILVHISHDEQEALDELQGGLHIDEATGFRDYSQLKGVIQLPFVKALFEEAVSPDRAEQHNLHELYEHAKKSGPRNIGYEPIASDFNPQNQLLDKLGQHGDDSVALMPLSVANYFDTLRKGRQRNTNTGLREYGFFKKVFKTVARIAAPIVGGIYGGPAGAAAASAAATKLTGGKSRDVWRNALLSGATTFAMPHVMGAITGNSASGLAGGWSQVGGGAAQNAVNAAGMTVPGEVFAKTATAASPGIFSGLSSYALPAALIGGGFMMANKGAKKTNKYEAQQARQQHGDISSLKESLGMNQPLYNRLEMDDEPYYAPSAHDIRQHHLKRNNYRKGGHVASSIRFWDTPHGDGQSDEIPVTLRSGDWILDASLVSAVGNGDTNAGKRKLKVLDEIAEKTPQIYRPDKNAPAKPVPALVSTGEGHIPRERVIKMGGGSLETGVKRLRKFTEAVRVHKASNKKGLPPAIKEIEKYLPPLKARG